MNSLQNHLIDFILLKLNDRKDLNELSDIEKTSQNINRPLITLLNTPKEEIDITSIRNLLSNSFSEDILKLNLELRLSSPTSNKLQQSFVLLIMYLDLGKEIKNEIFNFISKNVNDSKQVIIELSTLICEFMLYIKEQESQFEGSDSSCFSSNKNLNDLIVLSTSGMLYYTGSITSNSKFISDNFSLFEAYYASLNKIISSIIKSNFDIIISFIKTGEYNNNCMILLKQFCYFINYNKNSIDVELINKNIEKIIDLESFYAIFRERSSKHMSYLNNFTENSNLENSQTIKGLHEIDATNTYLQVFSSYLKTLKIKDLESFFNDYDKINSKYAINPKSILVALKALIMNIESQELSLLDVSYDKFLNYFINYKFTCLKYLVSYFIPYANNKEEKISMHDFIFIFLNNKQENISTFTTQFNEVLYLLLDKAQKNNCYDLINKLLSNNLLKASYNRIILDKSQFSIVEDNSITLISQIINLISKIKLEKLYKQENHDNDVHLKDNYTTDITLNYFYYNLENSVLKIKDFLLNSKQDNDDTKDSSLNGLNDFSSYSYNIKAPNFTIKNIDQLKSLDLNSVNTDTLIELFSFKIKESQLLKFLDLKSVESHNFSIEFLNLLFNLGYDRKSTALISEFLKMYIDAHVNQINNYNILLELVAKPFYEFIISVEVKNLKFLNNVFSSMIKQNYTLYSLLILKYYNEYLKDISLYVYSKEVLNNSINKDTSSNVNTQDFSFAHKYIVFFFLIKSFRSYKSNLLFTEDEFILNFNFENNSNCKARKKIKYLKGKEEEKPLNKDQCISIKLDLLKLFLTSDNWELVISVLEFIIHLPNHNRVFNLVMELLKYNVKTSYVEYKSTIIADLKTFFVSYFQEILRNIRLENREYLNTALKDIEIFVAFINTNLFIRPSETIIPYLELFYLVFSFFFYINTASQEIFLDMTNTCFNKNLNLLEFKQLGDNTNIIEKCLLLIEKDQTKKIASEYNNKFIEIFNEYVFKKDFALVLVTFLKESWFFIRKYSFNLLTNSKFSAIFDINDKTSLGYSMFEEVVNYLFSYRQMELEGAMYFIIILSYHNKIDRLLTKITEVAKNTIKNKLNSNSTLNSINNSNDSSIVDMLFDSISDFIENVSSIKNSVNNSNNSEVYANNKDDNLNLNEVVFKYYTTSTQNVIIFLQYFKILMDNNNNLIEKNLFNKLAPIHFPFIGIKLFFETLVDVGITSNKDISTHSNVNDRRNSNRNFNINAIKNKNDDYTHSHIIIFLTDYISKIIKNNQFFCKLLVNNGVSNLAGNSNNNGTQDNPINSNNDTIMNEISVKPDDTDNNEIDFSGSEDKSLVSYWISAKYSLTALGFSLDTLFKNRNVRLYSSNQLNSVQNYVYTLANLSKCLYKVINLMIDYKHMGAIMLLKEALDKITQFLNRSRVDDTNNKEVDNILNDNTYLDCNELENITIRKSSSFSYLTKEILLNFLNESIKDKELCSVLRRSAGIPHIICTLIRSYNTEDKHNLYDLPSFKDLFYQVIVMLTESFIEYNKQGKMNISVHCLNIMRVICDDSTLKSSIQSFYEYILVNLVDDLESKNWSIKNALVLMFSRIIKATFDNLAGSTNNSSINSKEGKTFYIFFSEKSKLYDKLHDKLSFIVDKIKEEEQTKIRKSQVHYEYDDFLMLITTIISNMKPTRMIEYNVFKNQISSFLEKLIYLTNYKSNSEVLYYQLAISIQKLLGCEFNPYKSNKLSTYMIDKINDCCVVGKTEKLNSYDSFIYSKRHIHCYFTVLENLINVTENNSLIIINDIQIQNNFVLEIIFKLIDIAVSEIHKLTSNNHSNINLLDVKKEKVISLLCLVKNTKARNHIEMFLAKQLFYFLSKLTKLLENYITMMNNKINSSKANGNSSNTNRLDNLPLINKVKSLLMLLISTKEEVNENTSEKNIKEFDLASILLQSIKIISTPFYNETLINIISIYSLITSTKINVDLSNKVFYKIHSQETLYYLLNKKTDAISIDKNVVYDKFLNREFFYANNSIEVVESTNLKENNTEYKMNPDIRLSHSVINKLLENLEYYTNNKTQTEIVKLIDSLIQQCELTVDISKLSVIKQNKFRLDNPSLPVFQPQIIKTVIYSLVTLMRKVYSNNSNNQIDRKTFFMQNTKLINLIIKYISSDNEDYIRSHIFSAFEILVNNLLIYYNDICFSEYSNIKTNKEENKEVSLEMELLKKIIFCFVLVLNDDNPEIRSSTCHLLDLFVQKYSIFNSISDESSLIKPSLILKSFEYYNVLLLRGLVSNNKNIELFKDLIFDLINRNLYIDDCNDMSRNKEAKIFYKEPDNRFIDIIQQKTILLIGIINNCKRNNKKLICEIKEKYNSISNNNSNNLDKIINCEVFMLLEDLCIRYSENKDNILNIFIKEFEDDGKTIGDLEENKYEGFEIIRKKLYNKYLN